MADKGKGKNEFIFGAVAEGHQLAQPAGLKEGRHQKGVAGSVDFMGQRVGIIDICRYLVIVLPVKMAKAWTACCGPGAGICGVL